ncbi:MAG: DNA-binding response regulator [Porticoccaceae bacterium]|nr:MAG: DNA-binding response regulator [Porticoccaceae bacterium]
MQILIVEDDRPLARGLQTALGKQGYAVNHVENGKDCLHVVATEAPDIIILDLGLPDMDGLKVLQQIRSQSSSLPVILLTARDSIDDKVAGLDCGADDYLAKPFEMTELFARLRVLERRLSTVKSTLIILGNVTLDTTTQAVTFEGQQLELSRKEYMLLKNLMENTGKVLTRATLETRLYSWGEEVCSNALEVHIHHLRKKLGADFIKTVRGVGYKVNQA